MIVLQINTNVNSGSTGRIAEEIGLKAIEAGYNSFIAAANTSRPSKSKIIQIGNDFDRKMHGLKTRLLDRHGFGSGKATKELVTKLEQLNPDLIHLHNIHGYYLHIGILFEYLKKHQKPVIWSFHDCWPFTGHCSHFERVNCYRWQNLCYNCPNKKGYPASYFIDRSTKNYLLKKDLFTSLRNLNIITPSDWLTNHVKKSFFKYFDVRTIYNGIDINVFKPQSRLELKFKYNLVNKYVILAVANVWNIYKGLNDIIKLSYQLDSNSQIVMIGLTSAQINKLPANIIGISHTNSISELSEWYSLSNVFINPTYSDNFPTTNLESLACGTPVITYNTGGSPEAIDENTGFVVDKGNIEQLSKCIKIILGHGKDYYTNNCRVRAETYFNKDDRFIDYLNLYKSVIVEKK